MITTVLWYNFTTFTCQNLRSGSARLFLRKLEKNKKERNPHPTIAKKKKNCGSYDREPAGLYIMLNL